MQSRPKAPDAVTAATSTPLAVGWLQLVISTVLTLGLTTTVALVNRRPLFGVLQLVCGTDVGGRS